MNKFALYFLHYIQFAHKLELKYKINDLFIDLPLNKYNSYNIILSPVIYNLHYSR